MTNDIDFAQLMRQPLRQRLSYWLGMKWEWIKWWFMYFCPVCQKPVRFDDYIYLGCCLECWRKENP